MWEGTRSDTILIVNIDPKTHSIKAISIPRDSKVYLPDNKGVQKINYEKLGFYDIVAITSVTSSVNRGYELASYFKQKGSYIVMGGHHVTLLPDEAAEHAATVMTGPADRIWREFISDYANGTPKKRYDGEHCDIGAANIIPMRELMQKSKYIGVPTVIANFGCTNKCEFCVINSFWGGKHSTRQAVQASTN